MSKAIIKHHASLAALVRYIDNTPRLWSYGESVSTRASNNWDLNTGYEASLKLARDGWREGATHLAQGLASLPAIQTTSKRSYGVSGSRPSVSRAITNNPRCMIRKRKGTQGQKPIVSIAVCVSANCNMDAEPMSNYGLAIARYVDELEAKGVRVELIAAIITRIKGVRCVHTWTVKEANSAMNLSDVAYSIGHPACFRRLGFALIERVPTPECGSYGQAQDLEASDLSTPAIILNGMKTVNDHSRTYAGALAYVGKVIGEAMDG